MLSIRALQLGDNDFSTQYSLPPEVIWNYEPESLLAEEKEYDIAIIDRPLSDAECRHLNRIVRAHCLFLLADQSVTASMNWLMQGRAGRLLEREELSKFLSVRIRNFYGKPYGEKFDPSAVAVSEAFHGSECWNGHSELILRGDFGSTMQQILCWRNTIPVESGQAIDFWLEYRKDPGVHVQLDILLFQPGSIADTQMRWRFSEEQMQDVVHIDNTMKSGPIFVTLNACGSGELRLIALHDRYSRRGEGAFFPGSDRIVTSDREEAFCYFDPGDLKPPLCVYFSGYRTQEGFEGYRMMRSFGCPFLLISDPRLEGGDFYIGSEEYEAGIRDSIRRYLDKLGFTRKDLVLSGLSMGSFGALYYGTMLQPKEIIVGKPLVSLGDMAVAERLQRPGGFPTSLDILWKEYHCLDRKAIDSMNARFWDRFDRADWSETEFIVAYMIEDDYDRSGYDRLLSHIESNGSRIIGKGLHGRHNDNTRGIVYWFLSQYQRILSVEYHRQKQD